MKSFANRTAVITGAAGGFGRAFSAKAHALGMNLVLSDIDAAALDKAAGELSAQGAAVAQLAGDVSTAAHFEALAGLAEQRFGAVHLLFNNAGVGCAGPIWESTEKDWQWVLNVNLWGMIHGVRVFTPRMLAAAGADAGYEGHIVNVASVAGLICPPMMGVYNVSKHAVVALSETLHHDLAMTSPQVRASVLCPGFVPTGIAASYRNRPADLANEAPLSRASMKAAEMVSQAVAGGKLTPADVADAAFAAIRDGRFYIFTHEKFKPLFDARLDDLRALANPRNEAGLRG